MYGYSHGKGNQKNHWARFLAIAIGAAIFAAFTPTIAQAIEMTTLESVRKTTTELRLSVDTSWVLITGFLVFFMQCGFAMLEAGLVRQTSVVNTLAENFVDAATTLLAWWATGFAIAFGTTSNGFWGTDGFFLNNALSINSSGAIEYAMGAGGSSAPISTLTLFFFQFAFAATSSTITTGSRAERTDLTGDLIYTTIMGAIMYPIVVHWAWNSGGWLNKLSYHDFAGSSVVHTVGGWTSLVGAYLLGPRADRVWGQIPRSRIGEPRSCEYIYSGGSGSYVSFYLYLLALPSVALILWIEWFASRIGVDHRRLCLCDALGSGYDWTRGGYSSFSGGGYY